MTEPAPCVCHQHLQKMLSNHAGHCCFRSRAATCHRVEVADWEARYEAVHGRPATVVQTHELDGNFIG